MLSNNSSKAEGEVFLIVWTVLWISFFAGVVVSEIYKEWTDVGYLLCGLLLSVPNLIVPNLFPSKTDKHLKWTERYITKVWIWIAIFNFIANYFFSHYFFICLGASYTFPITWKINEIPIALILITQSYFSTYFLVSTIVIRLVRKLSRNETAKSLLTMIVVLAMSYFFAFAETWTIESVPYYSFRSLEQMYKVGLYFYALYFIPSFPMFFWMDEGQQRWSISTTVTNALAAGMLAFVREREAERFCLLPQLLCDFWRLLVGNIDATVNGGIPFIIRN